LLAQPCFKTSPSTTGQSLHMLATACMTSGKCDYCSLADPGVLCYLYACVRPAPAAPRHRTDAYDCKPLAVRGMQDLCHVADRLCHCDLRVCGCEDTYLVRYEHVAVVYREGCLGGVPAQTHCSLRIERKSVETFVASLLTRSLRMATASRRSLGCRLHAYSRHCQLNASTICAVCTRL
jgi:hypothetical protein